MSSMAREKKRFFEWNPGKSLLASMRAWHSAKKTAGFFGFFRSKIHALRHKFWSVVAGADIPVNCNIGFGLLIPHPNGIVVHPAAIIGSNCLIMQQVTVGTTAEGGVPVIGNNVDIGAGAKILGQVKILDHAVIGANAVVISDVPAWHVAVGVPARLHLRKDAPSAFQPNDCRCI